MIKSTFPTFIVGLFLILCPAKGMINDYQEEERLNTAHAKRFHQSSPRKESSSLIFLEDFPEEILSTTFVLLDISDFGRIAQVSTRWKKGIENPDLWTYIGSRFYGDYLSKEDLKVSPKQQVIFHYLSVVVNATEDLNEIERLICNHRLNLYTPPCKKYVEPSFLASLVTDLSSPEEFIALGNREIIKRFSEPTQKKIEGLEEGKNGYEKNPLAARDANELLIKEGDIKAIEKKINGLLFGSFGYKIDFAAAREFNDLLVEKANLEAIQRKIKCLAEGKCGYDKNPLAARELNELLVKERNLKAIERKINGLLFGNFGYEMNLREAKEFNELLLKEGDLKAIERKKSGFSFNVTTQWDDPVTSKYRMYSSSHKEDMTKAREFNEFLIAEGEPEAMWEKILGLENGNRGYKRDPSAVATVLELLIEKGDPKAIEMKVKGLLQGKYGYEKDLVAARILNEFFVEKGNIEAIERKIEGLVHGDFCYEKNQVAVREFNELLIEKGNPKAIQRKLEGLLKGKYGYEKDSVAARKLLHRFLEEKANIKAIERQIEALEKGWDDREKDLEIAKELKELLVEEGNPEAIKRKIEGHSEGRYGYEKDTVAARKFNELLVEQGNQEATQRKIEGLLQGKYGYEKDLTTARELLQQFLAEEANIKAIEGQIKELERGFDKCKQEIAVELNESLVERGNLRAIERKIVALSDGGWHTLPFAGYCYVSNGVKVPTYGYEKDPNAARELNESLVKKGDPDAIERKMQALLGTATGYYSGGDRNGTVDLTYGYKLDLNAARGFNDFLIEKGNLEAIKRKIEDLTKGKYGYEKNPGITREFIESLVTGEFPIACGIGKYIKAFAMKYGFSELGYERDRENAIRFIKENHVPY